MPYVNLVPIINYIMYAWQEKFYILCQGGRFLYGPAFGCRAGIVPLSARSRSVKSSSGTKFKSRKTSFSLSTDALQGPSQELYLLCSRRPDRNNILITAGIYCHDINFNIFLSPSATPSASWWPVTKSAACLQLSEALAIAMPQPA